MDIVYVAKQFYIFWHKMCGYPGLCDAKKLIRKFTDNNKFDFGKYKGRFIADIIMADRQYIKWCIGNLSSFKLTEAEKALFNAGEKGYRIGGEGTEIIGNSCFSYEIKGDSYDKEFIDKELLKL